ncbi:hypothetical protein FQR65_LT07458 [Abscondita terminalis]|nr:hypothetical protein FQR65_LT07458 [Abscondita terminalis]
MSCPFNKDSLDKLKTFIDICKSKPEILHLEDLQFFRDYLQSLGATIPPRPDMSSSNAESKSPSHVESEPEEEQESEESDVELNMEGCIEPDVVDDKHIMGDSSKIPTDEDCDKADEKRCQAMAEFGAGNHEKAVELLSEAIEANPLSSVLFVKRGQSYLKLNKPNACIKDCTHALELNPDSAAGYKFRGRAYRLIAEWENAAEDLRQACKIDFDEQADEWLKEVTPNAQKLVQHKLKQERKKTEKDMKERAERVRKAKEAHAKAATADSDSSFVGGQQGEAPTGMGDYYKLLQDPEIMEAFKDPEIAAAVQDLSMDPSNYMKYQSNPKVMGFLMKLSQKKFPGGFPGFPGMSRFPGGIGGFPGAAGFGGAPPGPVPHPSADDSLD